MTNDWRDRANCRGIETDLFFPTRHEETTGIDARAVCAGCQVREECLEFALTNKEKFGIWGGLSERQRKRVRRGLLAS